MHADKHRTCTLLIWVLFPHFRTEDELALLLLSLLTTALSFLDHR